MKKEKIDIIEQLCGLLTPSVLYPIDSLVHICKVNSINCKNLKSALSSEVRKLKPRIFLSLKAFADIDYYKLNPDIDFTREREIAERNSVEGIAKAISEMTNVQNKRAIEEWISSKFECKMNEAVQKFVALEFQNEILPVLIQHIDKKLDSQKSVTKNQVKECIAEVFSDMTASIYTNGG